MALITAGITPSRTSVNANVASRVQTAMSAAAIRPSPPARAGPATRATTGLGNSQSAASTSASISAGTRPASRASAVSFRSAPEQKTGPVCESTTTRTAGSVDAVAERVQQLGHQGRGEGVAVGRAVQGQGGHPGVGGGTDQIHGGTLTGAVHT